MSFYKVICTFFGVGNVKFAPGTFGSLAAFPIWFLFDFLFKNLYLSTYWLIGFWLFILTLLFYLGVYCSDIYAQKTGKEDASQIVIDEVVGQLLAVSLSYYFVVEYLKSDLHLFLYFLTTFILFRFFDILKPGLIGYVDRNFKGGYGVMLDDVFAGIISALIIDLVILIKLL
jgi:phosphatidylglycerophosphatase A